MGRFLVTITTTTEILVEAPHEGIAKRFAANVSPGDWEGEEDRDVSIVRGALAVEDPDVILGEDGEPHEPPPPPLGEPPEEAWVTVGAHRWATDGWCAVREDGPRPVATYAGSWHREWRRDVTAERFASVLTPPDRALASDGVGPVVREGGDQPVLRLVSSDGRRTHARGDFGPLFDAGEARQGPHDLDPLVIVRDGEAVAVCMPIRVSDEDYRAAAEEAPTDAADERVTEVV